MKTCQYCQIEKLEEEFPTRNDRSGRLRPYCRVCDNEIKKARYAHHKRSNPFLHRCTRAKSRASSLHVPFNLTPEYLESIWTGICPVTCEHILWETDRSDENAAELDRFIPERGYVIGNVTFLSRRANRLKNSASIKELEKLIDWMKHVENYTNIS